MREYHSIAYHIGACMGCCRRRWASRCRGSLTCESHTWPTTTLSLQHSNEDERNAAWLMEIAGHTVNVLAKMRRAPDEVDTLPFWGLVDYVELEEFVAWAEERMQREAGPRLRSIAGEWRHAARTQRYFEGKGKKGWKGKGKGGKGRGPGGRASHSWQGWQWQGQGWQ